MISSLTIWVVDLLGGFLVGLMVVFASRRQDGSVRVAGRLTEGHETIGAFNLKLIT